MTFIAVYLCNERLKVLYDMVIYESSKGTFYRSWITFMLAL